MEQMLRAGRPPPPTHYSTIFITLAYYTYTLSVTLHIVRATNPTEEERMDPIDRLTERHRTLESVQPIYFLQRAVAEYDTPGFDASTQVSMVGRNPKRAQSFTFIWVDNARYRVSVNRMADEPPALEPEAAWECHCKAGHCMALNRSLPDGFECRKGTALKGPPWSYEE